MKVQILNRNNEIISEMKFDDFNKLQLNEYKKGRNYLKQLLSIFKLLLKGFKKALYSIPFFYFGFIIGMMYLEGIDSLNIEILLSYHLFKTILTLSFISFLFYILVFRYQYKKDIFEEEFLKSISAEEKLTIKYVKDEE